MRRRRSEIALCVLSTLIMMVSGLAFAPTAQAAAEYYIEDNATGGDCQLIGNWDNAYKTCTLNRDISITGTINGIEILDDDITLDGAGYELSLDTTRASQDGIFVLGRSGIRIANTTIRGFDRGIALGLCSDFSLAANRFETNGEGLGLYLCIDIVVSGNKFTLNDNNGLNLVQSSGVNALSNDFISNQPQQAQLDDYSIGGNTIGGNYWSDWDSILGTENCINTAPFDPFCDTAYRPASVNDTAPRVIESSSHRRDWTWYDDIGGNNWVLLANSPTTNGKMLFNLSISNFEQPLASLPGYAPGYVPGGGVIYNKYASLRGGPVSAYYWMARTDIPPITSQRVLWPKGGSSLEEVPGLSMDMFDSRLYWSWYDMYSPGYKNWILISNPNDYQVFYSIRIGHQLVTSGASLPANGQVARQFPGFYGGPVEVNAYNSVGDPVYVYASQRVLTNGDQAFNEVTGQPAHSLTDEYVWTWYDQQSPGALNWVLVANPFGAAGLVYFEVWIAGVKVSIDGPGLTAGYSDFMTFPGQMGGPVEVRCFSDWAHEIPTDCIASQRSIWGPSFEEVPGVELDSLESSYTWTWYDQKSPGALNWVLVANPSETAWINAEISFTDAATGTPVTTTSLIPPGGRAYPTFAGKIGGPVMVTAEHSVTSAPMPVIASQRVLWNGYFNEVWGQ